MNTVPVQPVRSEILQALGSFSMVMLARVGGNVLTLVYTALFTRMLAPDQFGAVFALWSLAMLLVPLATLNLGPVAIRVVVQARQARDDALAAGFIAFTHRTIRLVAPLVMLMFIALVWLRFPQHLAAAPVGAGLVALSIIGLANVQAGASIGVALDRAAAMQIPRELVRPVFLLLALALMSGLGLALDVNIALALFAVTAVINLAVQRWLLRDALAFSRYQTPRIDAPRDWIATGFALLPSRMVNERSKVLMIVIASAVLPLDQVALITVALSLSGLLSFAVSSVEIAFSAKLSRALHAGHRKRATKFLAVAGTVKLAVAASAIIVLLVLLDPVLALFGAHYGAAKDLTLILFLIPITKALFGKADLVLLVHDLRGRIFWVQLLTLALMPLAGAAAFILPVADPTRLVAWGFVLSFFVGYGGLWWIARSRTGIDTSTPGAVTQWLQDRATFERK